MTAPPPSRWLRRAVLVVLVLLALCDVALGVFAVVGAVTRPESRTYYLTFAFFSLVPGVAAFLVMGALLRRRR